MATLEQRELDQNTKKQPRLSQKEQRDLQDKFSKMLSARDERDQASQYWDGMTYLEYLNNNEKAINATTLPKKNANDWRSKVKKQTTFKKVFTIAGALMDLNIQGSIKAFDENDIEEKELSKSITTACKRTFQIEESEEKEWLALIELLKHGFVFIEDTFEITDRLIKDRDDSAFALGETIEKLSWKERMVEDQRDAMMRILKPNQVYLGDIRQFEMKNQPFIFVRRVLNYDEAYHKYKDWSRWKYVQPGGQTTGYFDDIEMLTDFRISTIQRNQVEEIKYYSRDDNEFQIILNGVPMLPVGYPLPFKHAEYNIVKRVLFPINPFFALGHGYVHKLKHDRETADMMLQLAIDKNKQSLLPPLAAASKRILDRTVYMPGKITYDLQPDTVKPIIQQQGLIGSEFQMIQMIENSMDETSATPTLAGGKKVQATQIIEQQKQARSSLINVILAWTWCIQDLFWLRAMNVLENYTDSIGEEVDPMTGRILKRYRSLVSSNERMDEGYGTRHIHFAPLEYHPTSEQIWRIEQNEKKDGKRVEHMWVDSDWIRKAKYRFFSFAEPSERGTSEVKKVMFKDFLESSKAFFPGMMDDAFASRRWSEYWGEDPDKLFPEEKVNQVKEMQKAQQDAQMQAQQGEQESVGPMNTGKMEGAMKSGIKPPLKKILQQST